MNAISQRMTTALLAAAALSALMALAPAHAALVHQYTFNGNANDSVGTAHATVVDSGAPTAVYTFDGQLDLSGNAGQGSNTAVATRNDAYVDLPNGIVSAAVRSGVDGAVSFEWWITVATQRTWSRLGDFGTSNGGEDVSDSGAASEYIMITQNSGRNINGVNNGLEMTNHAAAPTVGEPNRIIDGPFGIGIQRHVVAVYDHTNTTAGPNGTMFMYLDGQEVAGTTVGMGQIDPAINLRTFNDNNNWLGRSQWNDPFFDGSFNEFRIYDHALSAAEVTTNFNTGPVAVPLPTLIVNTVTGAVALKNNVAEPISIDYYEIESTAGRLNPTGWNSFSDQNLNPAGGQADFNGDSATNGADLTILRNNFGTGTTKAQGNADGDGDVDGADFLAWQKEIGQAAGGEGNTWDEAGGVSNNVLAELFLNGSTTIAPGAQVSLGNAFTPGAAGDLVFRFGIAGTVALSTGAVQYVTTGPATAVPEPGSMAVAAALAWIGAATLRRRR